MTPKEHEDYALEILSFLREVRAETGMLEIEPPANSDSDPREALWAIQRRRLHCNSQEEPSKMPDRKWNEKTYAWRRGVFASRNFSDDPEYAWAAVYKTVAGRMHQDANSRPAAYVIACYKPHDTAFEVWAIPEPVLFKCLESMSLDKHEKYTIVIDKKENEQIIRNSKSPDLTQYHRRCELNQDETATLARARRRCRAVFPPRENKKLCSAAAGAAG